MFVRHVLGIEALSELCLKFDSSGTENRDFTRKNVFDGFHGSIVDFTGLAQKQPISRARDTMKKEGPGLISLISIRYSHLTQSTFTGGITNTFLKLFRHLPSLNTQEFQIPPYSVH